MFTGTKEAFKDVAKGKAKYRSFQKRRKHKQKESFNKVPKRKVGEPY